MKKILTIGAVFIWCLSFNHAKSQVSGGLNLGVFKTLVDGTLNESDAQFGFNLNGKYELSDKMRIGANLGYFFRSYDVFNSKLRSFTMPITGSFEFSFSNNDFSPYAGADIGIYRQGIGGAFANGYLGIAPVFGFNYDLSESLFLNGNLKYHYIRYEGESTYAFGLNFGLGIKL